VNDRKILRREVDGSLSTHADLSDLTPSELNDMVVDGAGRAYVGSFGFDLFGGTAPIEPGSIYRIDPDGTVTEEPHAARSLYFPNGSAITADGATYIVAETFGNRISAFDLQKDGSLSRRRDFAVFKDGPPTERSLEAASAAEQFVFMGDGMCLDAEGMVWVADLMSGSERLARICQGGEVIESIGLAEGMPRGLKAFACMLGGKDGKTLFVCMSPDYSPEARKNAKEGLIVSLRVDVPRTGSP